MPKISVIIPVYNVEQYLRECLDSVINQTLQDIEVICIDDCGTDSSCEIIREYAQNDARIKIAVHDKNKGLGAARNTGIKNATGDYLFFLDSDDYLLPEALEMLYSKIISSGSDMVGISALAFADDDSEYTKTRTEKMNPWLDKKNITNYKVTDNNYSHTIDNFNCVAWGKLYSTKFIKEHNLMFIEQNVIHEDNGFWLKFCACYPMISYIDDIGLMYRIRKTAITGKIFNKNSKSKNNMKSILKDVFKYLDSNKKTVANKIKYLIKNSNTYCQYFETKFLFIFRCRWANNNKMIVLLGIPIYREKLKTSFVKEYRIFGIRFKMTRKKNKQETVNKVIEKYSYALNTNDSKTQMKFDKNYIWQLWFQGEDNVPPIIKAALASVREYTSDYNYKFLTKENFMDYVDIPNCILDKYNKGIIPNAQMSDYIRISLLEKYGGTWIDASCYMTDKIPDYILTSDYFQFKNTPYCIMSQTPELLNPSILKTLFPKNDPYKTGSNWFLHAKSNNLLITKIKNMLTEYWNYENELVDYFIFHKIVGYCILNNSDCKKIFLDCPTKNNFYPHILQKIFFNEYNENIYNSIKNNTFIHKLKWKDIKCESNNCYLSKIINNK